MEKINQLVYLMGLVLVMATCMTGNIVNNQDRMNHSTKYLTKKLQNTYCTTTTVRNQACHAGHCHNSTTYIHGCDTYDDDQCDNLTSSFNVHNSTGWRNTTCQLHACYEDIADDCGNANFTFKSCTNGDCRNGITNVHACLGSSHGMNYLGHASVLSALNIDDDLDDIFDTPCINLLFDTFRRTRLDSGK